MFVLKNYRYEYIRLPVSNNVDVKKVEIGYIRCVGYVNEVPFCSSVSLLGPACLQCLCLQSAAKRKQVPRNVQRLERTTKFLLRMSHICPRLHLRLHHDECIGGGEGWQSGRAPKKVVNRHKWHFFRFLFAKSKHFPGN